MKLFLLAALLSVQQSKAEPVLLVVAPRDWKEPLEPYLALKKAAGLAPQFLEVESVMTGSAKDWGANLRQVIAERKPDYVFLVGDTTKVPVLFDVTEIAWSPYTKINCLPTDALYAAPEGTVLSDPKLKGLSAAVGRLQANNVHDVLNYVHKAVEYHKPAPARGAALLLNDRGYDANDLLFSRFSPMLKGVEKKHGVVNGGKTPDATPADLAAAMNANAPIVLFTGHGTAQMWGSDGFALHRLRFTNARPIPLVLALACETALGAPNIPWYPYYTADQRYRDFTQWDPKKKGAITREHLGDVNSIQASTITENYSRRFTSMCRGGAMVYIGQTIVTHANYEFLQHVLEQLSAAYESKQPVRIGDIWRSAFAKVSPAARPWFFQLVGDPSTPVN